MFQTKIFSRDLPFHIGQPVATALELEGQLRVIHAETTKNRRVQVVNVNRIAATL
jgi:hypothetical protein